MSWSPNQEYLDALIEMGINKAAAEQALLCTNNESVEAAATYVFEYLDSESDFVSLEENAAMHKPRTFPEPNSLEQKMYKMVFVVNQSLNMGVGKIAAQVAHASLGLYRNMIKHKERIEQLDEWEFNGEKKIVLKGRDHTHLFELQDKASGNSLQSYIVSDAGHTQIPAGSVTVFAVFGEEDDVNSITGDLQLL